MNKQDVIITSPFFAARAHCKLLFFVAFLTACVQAKAEIGTQSLPPEIGADGYAVALVTATKKGDRELAQEWMVDRAFTQVSYCGEIAFDCMREDWKDAGDLTTISSQILTQSDIATTVELIMTWSKLGIICQQFRLVQVDSGWKVESVEAPVTCNN